MTRKIIEAVETHAQPLDGCELRYQQARQLPTVMTFSEHIIKAGESNKKIIINFNDQKSEISTKATTFLKSCS